MPAPPPNTPLVAGAAGTSGDNPVDVEDVEDVEVVADDPPGGRKKARREDHTVEKNLLEEVRK